MRREARVNPARTPLAIFPVPGGRASGGGDAKARLDAACCAKTSPPGPARRFVRLVEKQGEMHTPCGSRNIRWRAARESCKSVAFELARDDTGNVLEVQSFFFLDKKAIWPINRSFNFRGSVAQWIEQRFSKPLAVGSSPTSPATL